MSFDTQSSEDRSTWTPERPKLVIDAKKKTSEWQERGDNEDDVVGDDEGGKIMRKAIRDQLAAQEQEKARRAAMEKAKPPEPSLDDVERAKLDGLRARLAELQAAGQAIPAWKKFAESFGVGSEVARNAKDVTETVRQLKLQENVVTDLGGVPSHDGLVASMRQKTGRETLGLSFVASSEALQEIFRMLGNKAIGERISDRFSYYFHETGTRSAYGDKVRAFLESNAASGNPVQKKWAREGLKVLEESDASSKRYRDFVRAMPILPRRDNDDRSDGIHTPAHIDSQGDEMAA